MKFNKILIASLISASLLFTGFTSKSKTKPWRNTGYEDFTYEETLREERQESGGSPYTYFEYSVTNTGDAYITYVCQEGVSDIKMTRMDGGDVFDTSSYYSILPPNGTGKYCCKVSDYTGQNVFLVAEALTELAEVTSYGELNLVSHGPTGSLEKYNYIYSFSIDISYVEEEIPDEECHNCRYSYQPVVILLYKENLYHYGCSSGTFDAFSKEELDLEQLSLYDVIVIKHLSVPMGPCIVNFPFYIDDRALIAIPFILLGLTLSGAFVPVVILIVNKCRKPKEK